MEGQKIDGRMPVLLEQRNCPNSDKTRTKSSFVANVSKKIFGFTDFTIVIDFTILARNGSLMIFI